MRFRGKRTASVVAKSADIKKPAGAGLSSFRSIVDRASVSYDLERTFGLRQLSPHSVSYPDVDRGSANGCRRIVRFRWEGASAATHSVFLTVSRVAVAINERGRRGTREGGLIRGCSHAQFFRRLLLICNFDISK